MADLVKTLLESHSSAFNNGVEALFNTLFEAAGPVPVNSHDAVDILAQKVGENVHKTDNGADIVGLAAQAGMGDNPLPTDEDKLVNAINNDVAQNVEIPDLPTEKNMPNLPVGGGTAAPETQAPETVDLPEDDNSFGDEPFEDVSDNPPPDDFELPDIPLDGMEGEAAPETEM
jgi:hypothetical protein